MERGRGGRGGRGARAMLGSGLGAPAAGEAHGALGLERAAPRLAPELGRCLLSSRQHWVRRRVLRLMVQAQWSRLHGTRSISTKWLA